MKKVFVMGVGAQGSAAAKKFDLNPDVSEVICGGRRKEKVDQLVSTLKKGKAAYVDACDKESIVEAAKGSYLVVNALPIDCAKNIIEAAIEIKANYQDYASTMSLDKVWLASEQGREDDYFPGDTCEETVKWYRSLRAQFEIYGPQFAANDTVAIVGTGSAPGLICAATRDAMKYLDSCDTIYNFVWEGVVAKKFQPFWWSPSVALTDMSEPSLAFENGRWKENKPFSNPVKRKYHYMNKAVTFLDHSHDEPMQYGFHTDEFFRGCKNVYFKYSGPGMDFAKPLYEAGFLSHEKLDYGNKNKSPFDYVLEQLPPAPRNREEIQEILDEGLLEDSGCMAVEAYGKKDGKDVVVENHVFAPTMMEAFEKDGVTAEMYFTGYGGYLFSKMILDGKFHQRGLISSDMLTFDQVDTYFDYASDLDITMETVVKEVREAA